MTFDQYFSLHPPLPPSSYSPLLHVPRLDVELPVVTCPPLLNVRLPSTHTTVVVEYENLITATDNVGTGVIINVHPSDLRPFAAGTYNPVATATDSSGNSNSCTFTLTVSGERRKNGCRSRGAQVPSLPPPSLQPHTINIQK